MKEDLLQQIEQMMPTFSKSQKLIASYILNHYEKAAYMTALKLGNAVNVSESTVVRFAIELGYEGYPQLQRSLQSHIKNRLTSIQRMDVTRSRIGDLDPIEGVLTQDMDKIRHTLENVDREAFDNAVNTIVDARRVYIQGAMSSGEFVNDNDLAVLDNIVDIKLHDTICTDSLVDVVEQSGVLRIHQVLNAEVLLSLCNAVGKQVAGLCLLVDKVIAVELCFVVLLVVKLCYLVHGEGLGELTTVLILPT